MRVCYNDEKILENCDNLMLKKGSQENEKSFVNLSLGIETPWCGKEDFSLVYYSHPHESPEIILHISIFCFFINKISDPFESLKPIHKRYPFHICSNKIILFLLLFFLPSSFIIFTHLLIAHFFCNPRHGPQF